MKTAAPFFLFFCAVATLLSCSSGGGSSSGEPLASRGGSCIPEICGDEVDQDCDGGDIPCSGNDQDWDGFPAGTDCDDSNRHVYPGIAVSCAAECGNGSAVCQAGGFGACSCAPLCEAAPGGACYYISRSAGSDGNPGTFDSPWKSYLNIVSYSAESDRPANWRALRPGDVVYFLEGRYDESYGYSSVTKGFSLTGVRGSAGSRIAIKTYPGHQVVISTPANPTFEIARSSFITVEGIEIAETFGDGMLIVDSEEIELRNLHVHDVDGIDNNNLAGIKFNNVRSSRLHHSTLHDNYDRTNADTGGAKTGNSRNVVLFEGGGIRIDHNVVYQSPAAADPGAGGGCITFKHAPRSGDSSFEADHNILWNCFDNSIGSGTPHTFIHHNFVRDSDPIAVRDFGGVTIISDMRIENNTIVNGGALAYNPTTSYSGVGELSFRNNIVIEVRPAYSVDSGIVRISPFGNDDLFRASARKLSFSNNCYFNPLTEPRFNLFAGDAGRSGGLFGFNEWQQQGYDGGSLIIDPRVDQTGLPGEPACAGKGAAVGS